jgi:hypothetical protein
MTSKPKKAQKHTGVAYATRSYRQKDKGLALGHAKGKSSQRGGGHGGGKGRGKK